MCGWRTSHCSRGFVLLDLIVIHDHVEPCIPLSEIAGLREPEQIPE
jgi:hypothetical protein